MLMAHQVTQMRQEIDEIPSAVDRLLTHGAANMKQTAAGLRDCNPAFLTSVARGS
jgi:glucosamine--fructose-6-phosphate aminotransferase (isomerizing)